MCAGAAAVALAAPAAPAAELFDLADVHLLESAFSHARDLDRDYLLAHDVDRFVAPFRTEAGLPSKAANYPNWESGGLAGHSAGHYLTALAQIWAETGDAELKRRMDYMIAELAACQQANGDGYVGAIPGGRAMWADVAAGRIDAQPFGLNGKWVPWYNEHKLFAGLRDAWLIGRNAQARDVLVALADWCDRLVANLTDEQMQTMLRAEHGGMAEVLADVAAITGDKRYLALAQRFAHRAILDPLLAGQDTLTGLHANTQIPKVIGFARIAELGGDPGWAEAARIFWETVTTRRSVAFGGNSVREHFNPLDDFMPMLESREGPETCNTYNMLRLTEQLFRGGPEGSHADYYERALFNHILSSQHPEHGGFVYFTPIRPRHYRVYSQPGQCFWCCVGSGMENHGKYGQFIYAHSGDALFVNLFIASELDWKARGVRLRQETAFPDEPHTRFVVKVDKPQRFSINLRHPGWVAPGALRMRINGRPWSVTSLSGSYETITREWRDGDRVEVDLPMRTTVERLPDGSDYVAVLHGPILLAAKTGTERLDGLIADDGRMSHAAPGPYLPLDEAPMLVGDPATLAANIVPVPGKSLTFTARDLIRPAAFVDVELVPFFRVHDARAMLYWRTVTAERHDGVVAELAAKEKTRLALEARTLDRVFPGEQQPEVEHNFRGEDSNTGAHLARGWRDAGKWFSYDLRVKSGEAQGPLELIVTYFGAERQREFDIAVNERVIASVALDGNEPDRFRDVAYPIPPDLVAAAKDGVLTVKFVAHERSRAGAIYGVRLARVGAGASAGAADRAESVRVLARIAKPVLRAAAEGRLRASLPVHDWEKNRAAYTHLEAFGRTLAGVAPWLELGADESEEGELRAHFIDLVVGGLVNATDPRSPDFLNFAGSMPSGRQPLVDAAFLAHGLLRAPTQLWGRLDASQRANVVAALKSTRGIEPYEGNWLLFSAMIEAALWQFTDECELARIERAVAKHMEWYAGDGTYGDGPEFHWDYYNSFVIQPMLVDVLRVAVTKQHALGSALPQVLARARRYAVVQERLISPEGTFPVIGRSGAYRFGALQHLAQMALQHELPPELSAGGVRGALTAVIRRMADASGTFDDAGWLQIGAVGHQPSIREGYIATGSLYLCLTGLLHLGLPADDLFWTAPAAPWTQQRIWSGIDIAADKALKEPR